MSFLILIVVSLLGMKTGKGSTRLFIQRYKVNGHALWSWFMKLLLNPGKSSVYIGMGRRVKKPHL